MPSAFPPKTKAKKLRTRPRVKGSVVTGYTQTGTFGFTLHKHGLFMIMTDPVPNEHSNSGFRQEARCITCGVRFVEIDCEFLMVKANRDDVERVMDVVVESRRQLRQAYKFYEKHLGEI